VTLYALWLVLLTAAFIVHVPALAVAAAIATAVQTAYIIFVATSGTESDSGPRPRLSPRQIKILFWWRIGLFLVWLAFLVVAYVIHVPALAVVAMVMAALQGVGLGWLARMRRDVH
jgi:hypothetical protein